ncbi:MAG: trypsin-like peptidase domain-containing protein [Candidatus Dormiibacterota bacterium]
MIAVDEAPAERGALRPRFIVAGIGALIAVSATAGFLVTALAPDALTQAGRSVVGLTTTLTTGATVIGTGVIVSSSGEVVTSYGVVKGAVSIDAEMSDGGARYAATTFAVSPVYGVAVLQLINAEDLPAASIGDSAHVAVGDHVTAFGGPSTHAQTPPRQQGAVVALGQSAVASSADGANAENLSGLIEFNAMLPAHGTGGPLVDTSGRVIGLDATEAKPVESAAGTSGVAFAVPIGRVMAIVHDVNTHTDDPNILQGHGAFLGIQVTDSADPPGALIVTVEPGTPAQVAGMTTADVITSVNGVTVNSVQSLRDQLQRYTGGARVQVGWLDPQGRHHTATTQLAAATFT